ncbi:hypothetical protein IEQ44_06810 [Nocardioides sp. Y6]|uniref:Tat pathway signal sequence domain protein n=1 Tax=Nocardioides malaquae TaxID=2773426 RepID=A0ABR9RS15_9ACTN|nr:hypothetical protein [Nocardioides malaquae]MBE7324359.1 hypothetical protein [Nocardioides malaquae]
MSVSTSRRSLLRAGAWAAPAVVIASASPAYATSGATPAPLPLCKEALYTLAWAGSGYSFSRTSPTGSRETGRGTVRAVVTTAGLTAAEIRDAAPLMVVASNVFLGSRVRGRTAPDNAQNMRVSPFGVGNLGKRGLTLLQDYSNDSDLGSSAAARRTHGQELMLQFSRPVKNLRFTVTDIDNASSEAPRQYQDRVAVSGSPTVSLPAALRGAGTVSDPIRNVVTSASYHPSTSAAGNAVFQYRSDVPMDTVKITFWNDQSGTLSGAGLQGIFISDLTFTASTCA